MLRKLLFEREKTKKKKKQNKILHFSYYHIQNGKEKFNFTILELEYNNYLHLHVWHYIHLLRSSYQWDKVHKFYRKNKN